MLFESHKGRKLRYEQLEDKRMLATTADIVFLVDETGSDGGTQSWLGGELIPRLSDAGFQSSLINQGNHKREP